MQKRDILVVTASIVGVAITAAIILWSLEFLSKMIGESINIQETRTTVGTRFNFSAFQSLNL